MFFSKFVSPARVAALAVASLVAGAGPAGAQMSGGSMSASQMASPKILVSRINVNCGVVRNAVKAEQPIHEVLHSSRWKVSSDGQVALAERTHAGVTIADIWKVDGKYSWVHTRTYTSRGNLRTTQLCFRSDGTLARVRQAATIAALDGAAARQAYYNVNGSIIQQSALFEASDPAIVKSVTGLPYFKDLP
jgi:hypothetical protein